MHKKWILSLNKMSKNTLISGKHLTFMMAVLLYM